MANLSEQLKALFNEWKNDICKEIDHVTIDKMAKVDEILAPKSIFHKNKDKLATIKALARIFTNEMFNFKKKADNTFDYAAYIANMVDKIEDENDDEDEEPAAYCDNCGTVIWNVHKVVQGYEGKYCCDECRKEAEDDDDDEV